LSEATISLNPDRSFLLALLADTTKNINSTIRDTGSDNSQLKSKLKYFNQMAFKKYLKGSSDFTDSAAII